MACFFTLLIAIAALVAFYSHTNKDEHKTQKIHTLEQPLMLEGSAQADHNYLLPSGTTLYLDKYFPEGFVRYRIYVNVEGIDLPSSTLADPTEIRPISAYPIDTASLVKLLHEYPLTKNELASILKSSQLSKQDIREVLSEYN